MKKVLIIARDKTIYKDFQEYLLENEVEPTVCNYDDLGLLIDGDDASVVDCASGKDVKDFEKVVILSTSKGHKENYILSALACYCRKNQVPMYDSSFSNLGGKLYAMWKFWEDGIAVPKTAFGPVEFLMAQLERFGGIGVLKAVDGTKGDDNYLVKSKEEIKTKVEENPEIRFILQNFIPNDGDYRIIVLGFEPKMALYRHRAKGNPNEHRNNTSVGGAADFVELNNLAPEILDLSVRAAKSLGIEVAGADVLMDKETGKYYMLEVNRTPQMVTGGFYDKKFEALKDFIKKAN